MMTPKRVLVTGGTGFIDRGFVRCLLEACYDVTSFGLAGELPDASWNTPVRIVCGELRNPTDVVHAARDADVILGLGGSKPSVTPSPEMALIIIGITVSAPIIGHAVMALVTLTWKGDVAHAS